VQDGVGATPPLRAPTDMACQRGTLPAPSTGVSEATCHRTDSHWLSPSPAAISTAAVPAPVSHPGARATGQPSLHVLPETARADRAAQLQSKLQTDCVSQQKLKDVQRRFQWLKNASDALGRPSHVRDIPFVRARHCQYHRS
jgi:hypothetical protein